MGNCMSSMNSKIRSKSIFFSEDFFRDTSNKKSENKCTKKLNDMPEVSCKNDTNLNDLYITPDKQSKPNSDEDKANVIKQGETIMKEFRKKYSFTEEKKNSTTKTTVTIEAGGDSDSPEQKITTINNEETRKKSSFAMKSQQKKTDKNLEKGVSGNKDNTSESNKDLNHASNVNSEIPDENTIKNNIIDAQISGFVSTEGRKRDSTYSKDVSQQHALIAQFINRNSERGDRRNSEFEENFIKNCGDLSKYEDLAKNVTYDDLNKRINSQVQNTSARINTDLNPVYTYDDAEAQPSDGNNNPSNQNFAEGTTDDTKLKEDLLSETEKLNELGVYDPTSTNGWKGFEDLMENSHLSSGKAKKSRYNNENPVEFPYTENPDERSQTFECNQSSKNPQNKKRSKKNGPLPLIKAYKKDQSIANQKSQNSNIDSLNLELANICQELDLFLLENRLGSLGEYENTKPDFQKNYSVNKEILANIEIFVDKKSSSNCFMSYTLSELKEILQQVIQEKQNTENLLKKIDSGLQQGANAYRNKKHQEICYNCSLKPLSDEKCYLNAIKSKSLQSSVSKKNLQSNDTLDKFDLNLLQSVKSIYDEIIVNKILQEDKQRDNSKQIDGTRRAFKTQAAKPHRCKTFDNAKKDVTSHTTNDNIFIPSYRKITVNTLNHKTINQQEFELDNSGQFHTPSQFIPKIPRKFSSQTPQPILIKTPNKMIRGKNVSGQNSSNVYLEDPYAKRNFHSESYHDNSTSKKADSKNHTDHKKIIESINKKGPNAFGISSVTTTKTKNSFLITAQNFVDGNNQVPSGYMIKKDSFSEKIASKNSIEKDFVNQQQKINKSGVKNVEDFFLMEVKSDLQVKLEEIKKYAEANETNEGQVQAPNVKNKQTAVSNNIAGRKSSKDVGGLGYLQNHVDNVALSTKATNDNKDKQPLGDQNKREQKVFNNLNKNTQSGEVDPKNIDSHLKQTIEDPLKQEEPTQDTTINNDKMRCSAVKRRSSILGNPQGQHSINTLNHQINANLNRG